MSYSPSYDTNSPTSPSKRKAGLPFYGRQLLNKAKYSIGDPVFGGIKRTATGAATAVAEGLHLQAIGRGLTRNHLRPNFQDAVEGDAVLVDESVADEKSGFRSFVHPTPVPFVKAAGEIWNYGGTTFVVVVGRSQNDPSRLGVSVMTPGIGGGQWAQLNLKNAPAIRFGHSAVVCSNALVVYGGWGRDEVYGDTYFVDLASAYETGKGRWNSPTFASSQQPKPRAFHSCTLLDDETMLVYGGAAFNTWKQYSYFDDLWVLDIVQFRWEPQETQGVSDPGQRAQHTAVPLARGGGGTDIVVFGGVNGNWIMNDFYYLTTQPYWLWTQISTTDCPYQRVMSNPQEYRPPLACRPAAVYQNRMYMYGGGTLVDDPHPKLYAVDVVQNGTSLELVWSILLIKYHPIRYYPLLLCDDDGHLYLIGGADRSIEGHMDKAKVTYNQAYEVDLTIFPRAGEDGDGDEDEDGWMGLGDDDEMRGGGLSGGGGGAGGRDGYPGHNEAYADGDPDFGYEEDSLHFVKQASSQEIAGLSGYGIERKSSLQQASGMHQGLPPSVAVASRSGGSPGSNHNHLGSGNGIHGSGLILDRDLPPARRPRGMTHDGDRARQHAKEVLNGWEGGGRGGGGGGVDLSGLGSQGAGGGGVSSTPNPNHPDAANNMNFNDSFGSMLATARELHDTRGGPGSGIAHAVNSAQAAAAAAAPFVVGGSESNEENDSFTEDPGFTMSDPFGGDVDDPAPAAGGRGGARGKGPKAAGGGVPGGGPAARGKPQQRRISVVTEESESGEEEEEEEEVAPLRHSRRGNNTPAAAAGKGGGKPVVSSGGNSLSPPGAPRRGSSGSAASRHTPAITSPRDRKLAASGKRHPRASPSNHLSSTGGGGHKAPGKKAGPRRSEASMVFNPLQSETPADHVPVYTSKMIGRGTFGKVYQGLHPATGEFVAVKQLKTQGMSSKDLAKIKVEINLLKDLDHENIVRYLGSYIENGRVSIVMEYVTGGSLLDLCNQCKGGLPEIVVQRYMGQIVAGVGYLHTLSVMHRDIKPANILVDAGGICKVADFGASKHMTTIATAKHETSVTGTPLYMAPEIISGASTSELKSDVWSIGCTMIEVLDGRRPWYHKAKLEPIPLCMYVVSCGTPPLYPKQCSEKARSFLDRCFERNLEKRACCEELEMHPFVDVQKRVTDNLWGRRRSRATLHVEEDPDEMDELLSPNGAAGVDAALDPAEAKRKQQMESENKALASQVEEMKAQMSRLQQQLRTAQTQGSPTPTTPTPVAAGGPSPHLEAPPSAGLPPAPPELQLTGGKGGSVAGSMASPALRWGTPAYSPAVTPHPADDIFLPYEDPEAILSDGSEGSTAEMGSTG